MENLPSIIAEHSFCNGSKPAYIDLLISCARMSVSKQTNVSFARQARLISSFLSAKATVALEAVALQRGKIVVETVGEGVMLGWARLVPPYRWHCTRIEVRGLRAINRAPCIGATR